MQTTFSKQFNLISDTVSSFSQKCFFTFPEWISCYCPSAVSDETPLIINRQLCQKILPLPVYLMVFPLMCFIPIQPSPVEDTSKILPKILLYVCSP